MQSGGARWVLECVHTSKGLHIEADVTRKDNETWV